MRYGKHGLQIHEENYRLNAVFSASYMGGKKFDVQDRVFVKEENKAMMPIFGATCHNMYFVIYPFRRLFGIR